VLLGEGAALSAREAANLIVYPARAMPKKNAPNDFRPTTTRQRRFILGAAVVVFVVMWILLIWEPGFHPATRYPHLNDPPRDQPACAPGQATGCVGGKANVMLLPASAASAGQ
jgi:hypothetical protein